MNSAYMSDIMAQIGCYEWDTNMVGTVQVNWMGVDARATVVDMNYRKGNHEFHLRQHNNIPLVFIVWSNNAVVKSLSNFYSPIIIQDSVQRRTKIDNKRQSDPVGIPVPI